MPPRHHTQRKTEHTQPHVHPTRLLRQSGDGCAVKYPCVLEKLWWNLWRNPRGHYFPAPPTILLNSGDDGDQDGGFDAQTTACNRRQEAWIPPKGCLCAPASQEDPAQSYMKVSQSKNKTVLSGGHQADPPVTLLLFTERYSWKMHHCHPGYLYLLPETSGNKCGTFSEFPMKRVKNNKCFYYWTVSTKPVTHRVKRCEWDFQHLENSQALTNITLVLLCYYHRYNHIGLQASTSPMRCQLWREIRLFPTSFSLQPAEMWIHLNNKLKNLNKII